MYIKCDRCKNTVDDKNCFYINEQYIILGIFNIGENLVCFDCIGHQCCYPYFEQKYFAHYENRDTSGCTDEFLEKEHDEYSCILKDYKPVKITPRR